jgi:hypothetical protein
MILMELFSPPSQRTQRKHRQVYLDIEKSLRGLGVLGFFAV